MVAASGKTASRDRRWPAYVALLLAIGGVAWSAIFVRWAGVPGTSSAFYRVVIAASVLIPWRLATLGRVGETPNASRRKADRRTVLLALAGGAFFGCDLALYNSAVMRTTATTATLLGNTTPIFVGIGSWLFFRRRPKRAFWIGLALALTGAAVVMVATLRSQDGHTDSVPGDVMALVAAVFFAGYLLTTEHVREEMDTLTFSTIAIVGSGLTILVVCLAM